MCKKKNISHLLKQTIKLLNDRVMYGTDIEESESYYKNLLLAHGAYLLFNIDKGYVCAAGVLDNGYKFGTTPWSKIESIAVCKFGNGYGSLLMKYMVDAADGQTIFVYAVTDRNATTLEKSNNNDNNSSQKNRGKNKASKINMRDTFPFYNKYGFEVSKKYQKDHDEYIPPGTVPMVGTKSRLQHCLKTVEHIDIEHIKFFILIYIRFIQ